MRPLGMLRRATFEAVYRTSLVYNQCWEDPALDREALALTPEDRVLVITSAGCNALDYALTGARVVAVDANPRQNHLLELKLAGIRSLDFAAFFELFGCGSSTRARDIYAALRHELPDAARDFWDRHVELFVPDRAPGGSFYYAGTTGRFALAMQWYIDHVARVREGLERILAATHLDEQWQVYAERLRPRLLSNGLLRLLATPPVLALLGVPAAQRDLIGRRGGSFAHFLRDCLDHVMRVALLRDNYFWQVYVSGRYARESCPEYLKRPNFERLKSGLAANVETHTATVTQLLSRGGECFTAFVLLDHMDWLAERPRLLEEEWELILACAASGARAIFRSGAHDASFLPASITGRLAFERERATALHARDRVGTYGSFHIARLVPA